MKVPQAYFKSNDDAKTAWIRLYSLCRFLRSQINFKPQERLFTVTDSGYKEWFSTDHYGLGQAIRWLNQEW